MALNPPPSPKVPVMNDSMFSMVWYRWLVSIKEQIDNLILNAGGVISFNGSSGIVTVDTDDIPEGATNQYLTESRFNALFDPRLATKNENDLGGIPLDTTITYNASGLVETVTKDTVTKTMTYDGSGRLSTIDDGDYTKTLTYNASDQVTDITVTTS